MIYHKAMNCLAYSFNTFLIRTLPDEVLTLIM